MHTLMKFGSATVMVFFMTALFSSTFLLHNKSNPDFTEEQDFQLHLSNHKGMRPYTA